MFLKLMNYLILMEFALLKVLTISIIFFLATFLFKTSFEFILKIYYKKLFKNIYILETSLYYEWCEMTSNAIQCIKDVSIQKEYIETFNNIRKRLHKENAICRK